MSSVHDNGERLVGATLKTEQRRLVALIDSSDSSFSSIQSDFTCHSPLSPSNRSIPAYSGNNSFKSLPTSRAVAEVLSSSKPKPFSYKELKNATRKFGPDIPLAEGPSGYIFKGWINEHNLASAKPGSGLVIAVKCVPPENFEGRNNWLVNYLGQLRHPNIVKLIGYCSEGDNRLLVDEFMLKGSLEDHFSGRLQPPSWATRIQVTIGAARGLCFLHEAERQVMHGVFKPSNILLDGEFNAKLLNFGLVEEDPTGDSIDEWTKVMYANSHVVPEYGIRGCLTAKTNAYSFGIVLLELLSGRRGIEFFGTEMMDLKLEGQYPLRRAYTVATLVWLCVSLDPKQRPHMKEVLSALEKVQNEKLRSHHVYQTMNIVRKQ